MDAVIKSVRMVGMQAAVPKQRHSYVETPGTLTQEDADKVYQTTGIHSRRILEDALCASDLCVFAAESLIKRLDWDPNSIAVLIFVTQGSDYRFPATACLMQSRLGLATTAACMDIPLGCSGFVYAYWIASKLMDGSNGTRALILCGDTASRRIPQVVSPLFGDAGCATALEYDPEWSDTYAVFGTDGTGAEHISMKSGGSRFPVFLDEIPASESEREKLIQGSRLHLNGGAVFSFTLTVVPALIKALLDLSKVELNDIDMSVMHQANKFILDHLRNKIGIPAEKFIIDMEDFGNTSSASIPLAMCHKLADFFTKTPKKTILAGFGVGWSWGAILADIKPIVPLELVELPEGFEPLKLGKH